MSLDPRFLRMSDRFLQLIKEETGLDTVVCDEMGAIARATFPSCVGSIHAGAQRIMRGKVNECFVTAEEAEANPLVSEGQNCPVIVGGRRIGTVGIAGPLETTRPLVRIAAVLLAHWAEEIQPESASAPAGPAQRRRARVLLVHTSAELRERAHEALHERYDLLGAETLHDALAIARREAPDALLCEEAGDLASQLLSSMKFEAELSAIPLILLTDHATEAEALLDAGAADMVSRSFTSGELRARVRAAVRMYGMYPQLHAERKNLARTVRMLSRSQARTRAVIESALDGIVLLDVDGKIEVLNATAEKMFGCAQKDVAGKSFVDVLAAQSSRDSLAQALSLHLSRSATGARSAECEAVGRRGGGQEFPMECKISRFETGAGSGLCAFVRDLTEKRRLETDLQQAQKLEAVGRLAAGIAHEINTPIQFIGDNTQFLNEAFTSLCTLQAKLADAVSPEARPGLAELEQELDIEFVRQQVPKTLENTLRGVERVATIVRGMKEFAHPDQTDMVATDLNRAILATLEVARSEYKYVADVETDLGELPMVVCHGGDLNQVILNIVVNAAHAIADAAKTTQARGKISISTRREHDEVVVTISDTGTGIPEGIRNKVFDPFFTTKEVGRGTGQGLAIARKIVEKHRGSIRFETEPGKGTTFYLRLSRDGPQRPPVTSEGIARVG
jgi:PAS domain S-box-containing protein